jgi:hypothetical protein
MSTFVIGSVLDAIRAALVLRSGLTGVDVYSAPVTRADLKPEYILFGAPVLEEEGTLASYPSEVWTVDGEIRALAEWAGTAEATNSAARTRGLAVLSEIDAHIAIVYASGLPTVALTKGEVVPESTPDGQVCWVEFTMTVEALRGDS